MKNFIFWNMGPWNLIDTYTFRQNGGAYSVTVVPLLCEDTVEPPVWLDPHVKNRGLQTIPEPLNIVRQSRPNFGHKWAVLIPWCIGTARALTRILI